MSSSYFAKTPFHSDSIPSRKQDYRRSRLNLSGSSKLPIILAANAELLLCSKKRHGALKNRLTWRGRRVLSITISLSRSVSVQAPQQSSSKRLFIPSSKPKCISGCGATSLGLKWASAWFVVKSSFSAPRFSLSSGLFESRKLLTNVTYLL